MRNNGTMFLLGGADLPNQDPANIATFIEACDGRSGKIVVLTASPLPNAGQATAEYLKDKGAGIIEVASLSQAAITSRADARHILNNATGLMISGPNSLSLCRQLSGSSFAEILETRFHEGLHLAGAGSAAGVFCEHVLAHSEEGAHPRVGAATLTKGLGLLKTLLIDPFYGSRGPAGLLTALINEPFLVGIGLDPKSAITIPPGTILNAMGKTNVTILDPGELEDSNVHEARGQQALNASGLKLHILTEDMSYDALSREVLQLDFVG